MSLADPVLAAALKNAPAGTLAINADGTPATPATTSPTATPTTGLIAATPNGGTGPAAAARTATYGGNTYTINSDGSVLQPDGITKAEGLSVSGNNVIRNGQITGTIDANGAVIANAPAVTQGTTTAGTPGSAGTVTPGTAGPNGITASTYTPGAGPGVATVNASTVNNVATVRPGLVSAPAPVTTALASAVNADSHGYTATTITPEQQAQMSVQAQMGKYLDPNSPVNVQLQTQAKQFASASGLMNSSLALSGAMDAMTKMAAQLGTTDANTLYNVAVQNMGAVNAASAFTADAFNKASIVNAQNGTQVNIANANAINQTLQFNASQQYDANKTNVANSLQAGIINAQQANEIAKTNAQLLTSTDLANVKSINDMNQYVYGRAVDAGIINTQQANDIAKANLSTSTQITVAQLQITASQTLETMREANAQAIQSSQNLTSLYNTTQSEINNITQNKDMDFAAKQTAINNALNQFKAAVAASDAVTGHDLSSHFKDITAGSATPAATGLITVGSRGNGGYMAPNGEWIPN